MPSPWLNNSYDLPSRFFSCFFPHRDERLFNPGPLDLHTPYSPPMTFFSSLVRTGFAGLMSSCDLPTIDWTAGIFKAVWRIIVSSYIVSCNSLILALRFPPKLHWLRPLRFLFSIYTLYCAAVRLSQTPSTDWSCSRARRVHLKKKYCKTIAVKSVTGSIWYWHMLMAALLKVLFCC